MRAVGVMCADAMGLENEHLNCLRVIIYAEFNYPRFLGIMTWLSSLMKCSNGVVRRLGVKILLSRWH